MHSTFEGFVIITTDFYRSAFLYYDIDVAQKRTTEITVYHTNMSTTIFSTQNYQYSR